MEEGRYLHVPDEAFQERLLLPSKRELREDIEKLQCYQCHLWRRTGIREIQMEFAHPLWGQKLLEKRVDEGVVDWMWGGEGEGVGEDR